jgi:hypothetical protein
MPGTTGIWQRLTIEPFSTWPGLRGPALANGPATFGPASG